MTPPLLAHKHTEVNRRAESLPVAARGRATEDSADVHHDRLPTIPWVPDTHRVLKGFTGVNPPVSSVGRVLLSLCRAKEIKTLEV